MADANGRQRRVCFVGPPDEDGSYRVGLTVVGAPRPKFVGHHEVRLVEESTAAPDVIVPPAVPLAELPAGVTVPDAAMPHQRDGIAWLARTPGAILADLPGLGKTLTSIGALVPPALVVCPAVMKAEWADEVAKWRSQLSTVIISGAKPVDASVYTSADVVIVNYDVIAAHEEALLAAHKARPFETMIADEAHSLKTLSVKRKYGQTIYEGSARAKTVALLSRQIRRRYLLSATPVLNRPVELFPLLHMVDPDAWSDYVEYGKTYCDGKLEQLVAKGGRRVMTWNFSGASKTDELHQKLSQYMLRRTKDILSLPSKTRTTMTVSLSREVAQEYVMAANEFLAWVEQNGGPKAVAKAKRSQQLAKMSALRGLAAKGKILPAVDWIVAQQAKGTGPLVVMAHHSEVIEGLESALLARVPALRIGRIVGGQSEKKRKADKEAFQRGELDVILCSILAAGVGLTLTRSAETLFVERSWRPMDLVQAEDRIHRIGQTRPVTITYMDGRGTIDEVMAKLLLRKTATIAGVIEGEAIDEEEAGRRVFGVMFGRSQGEQMDINWSNPT